MMIIFTTLANVFIQNGFNSALIRDKEVKEEDYSSVFWVSLGIAVLLYIVLFFAAPAIAVFFEMGDMVQPFRFLALMLLPGALNSVQLAKVSREMDFKKIFYSNVVAIVISGVTGILLALNGAGIWALVIQNVLNSLIAAVVMLFTVKWYPVFVCNFKRIGELFSFGWKILVSGLLDMLYQDIRSLVIGKKYNSETLGYYNRGKQFPQFIINAVNGAVQSVMLPALAEKQDNMKQMKKLTRNSIMLSAYIIFPMMAGLAGVSAPLITLLLTDKWLPSVPYMQIYCFSLAFYPVHSCNLQAINAMGRSDLFLKLEIIKKSYGMAMLVIAVFFFESPIAIAMTGVFSALISSVVNAAPNKKLIDYSYMEQMKDILPTFFASFVMLAAVLAVGTLPFPVIAILALQILVGIGVYLAVSVIIKIEPFYLLLDIIKKKKNQG